MHFSMRLQSSEDEPSPMHAAAFCDKHHRLDFPSPELTSVSCISAGSRSSASADDTSVALGRQELPQNCNREEFELWRQDVAVLEALLTTSPTQERHKYCLPCGLHVDGKWEGEQEDQGWWKRYEMQASRLRDMREEMLDRLRREACARPEPLTDQAPSHESHDSTLALDRARQQRRPAAHEASSVRRLECVLQELDATMCSLTQSTTHPDPKANQVMPDNAAASARAASSVLPGRKESDQAIKMPSVKESKPSVESISPALSSAETHKRFHDEVSNVQDLAVRPSVCLFLHVLQMYASMNGCVCARM